MQENITCDDLNRLCLSRMYAQISETYNSIKEYVTSTPNWIFYFIDDETICSFLNYYGDEWEDEIEFVEVTALRGHTATFQIRINDQAYGTKDYSVSLCNFDTRTKFNYDKYCQGLADVRIEECKKTIARYEVEIEKQKELIKKLQYERK